MKKDIFSLTIYFFERNKLNPLYTIYIVDDANQSVINDNKTNSPPPTNPPLMVNDNEINTINNNKINIDKNKLNLCFLTEYLIDWNFIKLNDINLFSYDNFLTNLLNEGKYTYDEIMKVVAYVATRIMKNNYLDENKQPINGLLSYFKTSCITNLGMNERIDEWLKEVGMI